MTERSIGMMDSAYFVGRKEIIDWLNALLQTSITRVEETASGAIACQVLDAMYPGRVPLHKVKWNARGDYDFIQNYKVLQSCFNKLGINRHIDVDRLIRAKYQDNLEFMQWLKAFFESNPPTGDYDALERRTHFKDLGGTAPSAPSSSSTGTASAAAPAASGALAQQSSTGSSSSSSSSSSRRTRSRSRSQPSEKENRSAPSSSSSSTTEAATKNARSGSGSGSGRSRSRSGMDSQESAQLRKENGELRMTVDGLEKERDFYFDKLREIEIIFQRFEQENLYDELTPQIMKILYATTDDFVVVEGEEGAGVDDGQPPSDNGIAAKQQSVAAEPVIETDHDRIVTTPDGGDEAAVVGA